MPILYMYLGVWQVVGKVVEFSEEGPGADEVQSATCSKQQEQCLRAEQLPESGVRALQTADRAYAGIGGGKDRRTQCARSGWTMAGAVPGWSEGRPTCA